MCVRVCHLHCSYMMMMIIERINSRCRPIISYCTHTHTNGNISNPYRIYNDIIIIIIIKLIYQECKLNMKMLSSSSSMLFETFFFIQFFPYCTHKHNSSEYSFNINFTFIHIHIIIYYGWYKKNCLDKPYTQTYTRIIVCLFHSQFTIQCL